MQLQQVFGLPVVALELADPRFYHLHTALAVLDSETIAYYSAGVLAGQPGAAGGALPGAILTSREDARVLGLNATSNGRHVVLWAQAERLAEQFAASGFEPVPVDVSELLEAGAGVSAQRSSCTQLRSGTGLNK